MDNVLNQSNKWMMYEAGVLNYWYYKYETFPFENGHLIIKGANGTGKSVTTQSFLPLLLDGNKQPSRLDPFGSRSRKMIDYIFGENPDIQDKTCYLFLVYKKKFTEEYITTGIGFKANIANGTVDSWHFLIKNKRIGVDFDLFKYQLDEVGEKVMVPLSQKELENYVDKEKCGYVKVGQKEYAELVNKYIFKFSSLEDYLDMVNLVVRIRTPKLSNDLGPQVIYQILERSLPEITLNDLRSLTETIQNIDLHNQRLDKAKEDYKLIKKLSNQYQEYNKAVLSHKASHYLKSVVKMETAEKSIKKANKELTDVMGQLETVKKTISNLETEQEAIEAKLRNLEDNDVIKAQRELNNQKALLSQVEQQLKKIRENLETKQAKERQLNSDLKAQEDELFQYEKHGALIIDELDDIAQFVDFDNHELQKFSYESKMKDTAPIEVIEQWREIFKSHENNISEITKLLNTEQQLKSKLDDKDAELSALEEEKNDCNKSITELETRLEDAIDSFKQDVLDWNSGNEQFILEEKELKKLSDILTHLYEGQDISDIVEWVNQAFIQFRELLIKEKANYQAKLQTLERDVKDKENELKNVRNKVEPEPTRSPQTENVRKQLRKEGVPFVPFYEAVEFKNNLTEEDKERLESSLTEMGVLDGLIVKSEQVHRITETESILVPQPVASGVSTLGEYLDVVLPEGMEFMQNEVKSILGSIAIEEVEDGSYVTNFGSYQHGIVKGYAIYNKTASFIGKEARKKYREELIKNLESELSELLEVKAQTEEFIQQNNQSNKTLTQEKDAFPSTKAMSSIQANIEDEERRIKGIDEQKGRIEIGLASIRIQYNQTRLERTKRTEGRTVKLTLEAYEEAKDYCRAYLTQLDDLRANGKDYNSCQLTIRSIANQIDDVEFDIEELISQEMSTEKTKDKHVKVIKDYEDFLSAQGVSDIEKEIQEAEKRKLEIPKELLSKATEKGGLEMKIPELTKNIRMRENGISFYKNVEKIKGDIFVSEINKKFIEAFDRESLSNEDDIYALAELVVEELGKEQGEVSFTDVSKKREDLIIVLRDVSLQGLEDYHPNRVKDSYEIPSFEYDDFEEFNREMENLKLSNERIIISLTNDSKTASPMLIMTELESQINIMQAALRAEDEKMYKEIILDKIGERIRELISKSKRWEKEINKLMSERNTSSGLKLSIEWKAKESKELDELKTSDLISLLEKDPGSLKDPDYNKLTKHFTSKIKFAKELYENDEENKEKSLEYVIKDVLDYRKWFEFKLKFRKGEGRMEELTKNKFNALSGGERAMSMYIPLLSALFSKYGSASAEAPYIISMDEAFAGVDENNIRDMFELMGNLDLNYILNSQSLWGDYDTVDSLAIAEIIRPKNSKDVTVVHFKWDGKNMDPREVKNKVMEDETERVIHLNEEQQDMFELLVIE